jgi:hypothetical protein
VLIAPADGLIGALNVQAGVPAPLQGAALVLVDDSVFYVNVMIDEMEIGKMALGQAATVTLEGLCQPAFDRRGRAPGPAPTNVGVSSPTMRASASPLPATLPPRRDDGHRHGRCPPHSNVNLIPNWAIRNDQSDNTIYTYRLENGFLCV